MRGTMGRARAAAALGVGLVSLGAFCAAAQEAGESAAVRGQGWSIHAGRTVGQGRTVLAGELGWPGLQGTVLHGTSPTVDLGAKLSLQYGVEGLFTQLAPGIKVQGLVRLSLLERGRVALGLELAPGVFSYFTSVTSIGLALPVELVMGVAAGSALQVHLAMEVPLYVTFGALGGAVLPILFGGGAEYFIDRSLAATFQVRMGPSVDLRPITPAPQLAFEALVGVQYRL